MSIVKLRRSRFRGHCASRLSRSPSFFVCGLDAAVEGFLVKPQEEQIVAGVGGETVREKQTIVRRLHPLLQSYLQ